MEEAPNRSYQELLARPFSPRLTHAASVSTAVTPLPARWSGPASEYQYPGRLSNVPDMIHELAENFRTFAARCIFTPSPDVCRTYALITEPLTEQQQARLLPDPIEGIRERYIT